MVPDRADSGAVYKYWPSLGPREEEGAFYTQSKEKKPQEAGIGLRGVKVRVGVSSEGKTLSSGSGVNLWEDEEERKTWKEYPEGRP